MLSSHHIHICIIVCGATTGSHFTQNLLLNAQQCRYVRLCNKLYILKLVLTKSYKEILVFFLNTLTAAFSYVCRLSEIQKVLLEVKSPSYAFLTFHFYTPPIGEENGFGRIISVEVFKKLQKFSVSSVLKPIFWENSNSN